MKIIHSKILLVLKGILHRLSFLISTRVYLKLLYYIETGRKLNLCNPVRFTEKIQWLKLYCRRGEYTTFVDKAKVKDIVKEIIGEKYIIPTLAYWNSVEEIDISILPNEFVLKTTHGGGNNGVIICRDKKNFDLKKAIIKLKKAMKNDIYSQFKEWPYKNVKRGIIAEKFMSNTGEKDLTDYKFFCFNGKPQYCQVIADRNTKETIDFYDMEWNHQAFYGLNRKCKQAKEVRSKPKLFEDMIDIATKLSCGIPFLRVDLYVINEKIYFGEMTFYPASGLGAFTPDEWDYNLGKLIMLPKNQ